MVIAPWTNDQETIDRVVKSSGFDPNRDKDISIDIIKVAERLDQEIEMSEAEFRDLVKKIFDLPSYQT